MHVHMLHMPKSGTGFMHGSGQLSASHVSLLILILVVFIWNWKAPECHSCTSSNMLGGTPVPDSSTTFWLQLTRIDDIMRACFGKRFQPMGLCQGFSNCDTDTTGVKMTTCTWYALRDFNF